MRWVRTAGGGAVLVVALTYLVDVVDPAAVADLLGALLADPAGLVAALGCYALAFGLRAAAWRGALPGLRFGQSWAALHVSLLGNHVLPLRLGEVLRVTSVLRRTTLAAPPVLASALTLRAADLAAVVGLAALCVPTLAPRLAGGLAWGVTAAVVVALLGGLLWSSRLARGGAAIRVPSGWVALCVVLAWVLESAVVWEIARTAGHPLGVREALAVTAVTIVVQAVAVAPGGFGSYEAAATAALVALGVPAGPAFAIALTTHGAKTGYALLIGAVALVVPGPSYWGWLRLPPQRPPRPAVRDAPANAPVVVFLPAHDEQDTVGAVVAALPDRVGGRPVRVIVVDDGSTDGTAAAAAGAGALVVSQRRNLGLGAAVRRGLAEAVALGPAAVVYLDADGEYSSSDVGAVAAPVLGGVADYVVGSRFAGAIDRMLPHRRFGNRVLTAWVRWLARRRDITDGQSGFRAFSPAAAADAEVVHDYNYAQVLTLDLLGKGYSYAEVPIHYSFRTSGTSFVRLGRYLRRVLPAVHRELNKEWSLAARGAAGKRCAAPTPRPATSAGTPASTPTSS